MELVEMTNEDKRFYPWLGPFLGAREVHAELGGPVYDDPGKRWWVAREGSVVLGFCALTVKGGTVALGSAYVVPEARARGVYQALFSARFTHARNLGMTMRATVRPEARKPFERCGFRVVRETTNYVVFELEDPNKTEARETKKRKARR